MASQTLSVTSFGLAPLRRAAALRRGKHMGDRLPSSRSNRQRPGDAAPKVRHSPSWRSATMSAGRQSHGSRHERPKALRNAPNRRIVCKNAEPLQNAHITAKSFRLRLRPPRPTLELFRTVDELEVRACRRRPRSASCCTKGQRAQALSCALIHNERRTSYEQLNRHASQIANGLAALGVNRGQRVAFLGKNSDLYFELLLGAARAGVTTVPLNWRLATPEIAAILADAHISMLFLGLGFAGMLPALALREDLPRVAMDGALLQSAGRGRGMSAEQRG